jgi:hypothetical protein
MDDIIERFQYKKKEEVNKQDVKIESPVNPNLGRIANVTAVGRYW